MWLTFLNPAYLWLLLIIPIIWYLYHIATKKKKRDAMKFSHLSLIKKAMAGKKTYIRTKVLFILSLVAIAFIIIALADPHIPLKRTKEGVNVVLAIDVSGSMQAQDYSPNRMEAAKRSAEKLIDSLHAKDQVGIVLFESGASTAAFLSPFKDRVIEKLRTVSLRSGRTAIGDGLSLAIDMASSIPNKKKIVILLSDGVNNAGVISPDEAIQFALMNKIQVYTVGMGSDEPVVLGYDWFGNPQYAELDETTLKNIAAYSNGQYFKSVDDDTLDQIYETIAKDIKREREPTSIKDVFLFLTIVILLVELYIRFGRKRIIH